jgi:hypothetical protein
MHGQGFDTCPILDGGLYCTWPVGLMDSTTCALRLHELVLNNLQAQWGQLKYLALGDDLLPIQRQGMLAGAAYTEHAVRDDGIDVLAHAQGVARVAFLSSCGALTR